jgi:hypothetical protein
MLLLKINQTPCDTLSSFDSFWCGDVSRGTRMVWTGTERCGRNIELIGFIAEELDLASTYVLHLFVHYLSVFRRSRDVIVGTGNIMDLT